MGNDAALAFLSERPRALYDYFSQLFAQVTNPPLDAIREELVTSLHCQLGSEQNLLAPGPASCRKVILPFPVLSNDELAKIIHINDDGDHPGFASHTVRGIFPAAEGGRRPAAGGSARSHDEVSGGDRERRAADRAVQPRRRRGQRADPVAAAHRGRAPAPGQGADAHPGRADRRGRRRPRGAPHRAAAGLRRRRGQPVSRHGHRRGPRRPRRHPRRGPGDRREEPGQGARQGRAQDHVEDGRLDGRLLHRRADLRGRRARART